MSAQRINQPLIVQSDWTILLEVNSPRFEEARYAILPFAELVKRPEYVHVYRMTRISLWNAAAIGLTVDDFLNRIKKYSRYELPSSVVNEVSDIMARYGRLVIESGPDKTLIFRASDAKLFDDLYAFSDIANLLLRRTGATTASLQPEHRGILKQALIHRGYPAIDSAGYSLGAPLQFDLKKTNEFILRDYQIDACNNFLYSGSSKGGSGIITLPCGAGKTIVAMAIMEKLRCYTMILATNITAIRQWKRELLEKTTLEPDMIGEYSSEFKQIRPITIVSYQSLTYRNKSKVFTHFETLNENPWGLIVYDEVHTLPAQVFRFSASVQSIRRVGLTATLVREDGKEGDVFSLIGPKCFDTPWKDIESKGWIAKAVCKEIRVECSPQVEASYMKATPRNRYRIASENDLKLEIIDELLKKHLHAKILVIGQYLSQLDTISKKFQLPIITGKTRQNDREQIYNDFRTGNIRVLAVSSVANFAVDLPDANVAIQVSGKFGSRQEEAQRLGRVLRPKLNDNTAYFYTIVSKDTEEQDFALNRQLFLAEQGYTYDIIDTKAF